MLSTLSFYVVVKNLPIYIYIYIERERERERDREKEMYRVDYIKRERTRKGVLLCQRESYLNNDRMKGR